MSKITKYRNFRFVFITLDIFQNYPLQLVNYLRYQPLAIYKDEDINKFLFVVGRFFIKKITFYIFFGLFLQNDHIVI